MFPPSLSRATTDYWQIAKYFQTGTDEEISGGDGGHWSQNITNHENKLSSNLSLEKTEIDSPENLQLPLRQTRPGRCVLYCTV